MLELLNRVLASIFRRARHVVILSQARKKSRDSILQRRGNNVLVLCYGNIYRSPLAKHLLKKSCPAETYHIRSAGFHKKENRSCDPEYLKILKERGYNLYDHKSKTVDLSDIAWANVILIMDRYNWDMLNAINSASIKKSVWIGALSKTKSVEVIDPYGKGLAVTGQVIRDIETCIDDICLAMTEINPRYDSDGSEDEMNR
ncbi:MAG: low molecular weight phosphatase family protein [Candidatus Thiodiazotropha sp.]